VSLRPLRSGRLANRRSTAVFCQYRAVLPNRTGALAPWSGRGITLALSSGP